MFDLVQLCSYLLLTSLGYNSMSESGSPTSSASGTSVATAEDVTNSPAVYLDTRIKVFIYVIYVMYCAFVHTCM